MKNNLEDKKINSVPLRADIEEKFKWNISDIYNSDDEWEKDFKWVQDNLHKYKNYEGKLSNIETTLFECLNFDTEIGIKLERLYLYAMLSRDSDLSISIYQSFDDRIKNLYSQVLTHSAFIKPEIIKINKQKLFSFITTNDEFKFFRHFFDEIFRTEEHTLSDKEEAILAAATEITSIPYDAFSMFTNSDLSFGNVTDENGDEVEISHGRFYAALYSSDKNYRERVYKSYYKPFKEYSKTFSVLLNGNLKASVFNAKIRNYKSARESSLSSNNISISIYDNLIKSVSENLSPMHRWASLKKRILKLDELHPYDAYVSITSIKENKKYDYEESLKIVYDSLKILGDEYLESLKKAFNNRWIDVHETKSKKSGAYSSGTTFGVHPYVLLNWKNLLNDVFTLSHEMGHNIHSYFTGKNQPYIYANYSIFLAEVASTFNESLLLDHLISISSSKDEKLFLLERYLNNATATFYRQTMFAEFEKIIYEKIESGEFLTSDNLRLLYKSLFQKYWGPEMIVDEEEEFTWARIPHFYYNFYVYQYATGFAASEALVQKIKNGKSSDIQAYLNFLKAGSSNYPLNILSDAGVDMNSSEPIIAVANKMNLVLDEFEKLI
ncbi:MAG: oligoendopeptidase F [Chlorobiaceae bacterium]|nr:oligoendopeptidase F [Chlorobiaceae bacterium]MBA4309655.1 oligoendopeptidase F [Chlorobiaceae bacterium]